MGCPPPVGRGPRAPLAVALVLAVAGAGAGLQPATAAVPAQDEATLPIIVTAHADVTGGSDPACPACDGQYGDADEDFALTRPLSALRFEIRDGEVVVGQGVTSALGGLQTARLDVPAPAPGVRYEAVLIEAPADWMLCFDDQPRRSFDAADAGPDGVRVTWRFYAGCERDRNPQPEPTRVPATAVPATATAPPTALPAEPAPTPALDESPVADPPSRASESPSRSDDSAAPAAQAPSIVAPARRDAEGRLGSLRGRAFLDADADGRRAAHEIGMADVGVHLHGGGLQLMLITDATGEFGFDALGAGDYELFVAPGPQWRVTTPTRRTLRVAGETQLDLDFGLTPSDNSASTVAQHASAPLGEALPRLPDTGAAGRSSAPPLHALGAGLATLALLGLWQAARRKEVCL